MSSQSTYPTTIYKVLVSIEVLSITYSTTLKKSQLSILGKYYWKAQPYILSAYFNYTIGNGRISVKKNTYSYHIANEAHFNTFRRSHILDIIELYRNKCPESLIQYALKYLREFKIDDN